MVHRIDRDTSGVVIIAKNPLAVGILDQLLAKKELNELIWLGSPGIWKIKKEALIKQSRLIRLILIRELSTKQVKKRLLIGLKFILFIKTHLCGLAWRPVELIKFVFILLRLAIQLLGTIFIMDRLIADCCCIQQRSKFQNFFQSRGKAILLRLRFQRTFPDNSNSINFSGSC